MHPIRRQVLYLPGYSVNAHHRGIVRYARQAGWVLHAGMAYTGKIPEIATCDGVISYHNERPEIVEKIRELGAPTVDLSNGVAIPGLPKVLHNQHAIGRLAAEHLLARGFRRIAFAGWFLSVNDTLREAGLKETVEKAGQEYIRIFITDLVETVRRLPKPVAVMIQNDMHATEAEMRLLAAGFDVPHEVAVIGVDNDELYCDTAPVPVSSVDSAVEQCGYEAARLLDRLMSGDPAPDGPVLVQPGAVIERESTRLIAIPHAPTSRALAFIRGRFTDALDLDEVARSVGLGRRRLEDYFKLHLGRTMAEELRRLRLEEASKRILGTRDKLSDIATGCGFADGAHLAHAFRAEFGESPESYRKRSRT